MSVCITRRGALLGAGALLAPAASRAQGADDYPNRSIRLIVPWPPGGPIDLAARPVAQRMADLLGQTVVVENRAGANGTIGAAHVAQAPPDGYTLLIASPGTVSIYPLARGERGYDPMKLYAPVSQLVSSPSVLIVRPDLPAQNLAEMIAFAKANPGKLTYGSAGPASINHLSGATLAAMADVEMLHVPYQGAAPMMNDIMAGRVDMAFTGIGVASRLMREGKVRGLALGNARRSPVLPDVPTVGETYAGFQADNWYGLLAPAGTPQPIVQKLHATAVAAVNSPEVSRLLRNGGVEPEPSASPAAFAQMMLEDLERWRLAVRAAGLGSN
ncbi:MAG TPA: tripartite tricarboxylate transporter substrate binding protein [Falsiroseomonas sp.]|jgi:tripartite-type tricarboxylate transporter receptor subunit TctC|nr:tripartite tricarboxylate transporter substrate binding protein [Falsiroseomonas sp.]